MSISRKGCGLIMARKITMNRTAEKTFEDVFSMFITSKTANGSTHAARVSYIPVPFRIAN
ncbi:MAG: hypothetical protein IIW72_04670 [Clostridia bacterium]|nr:hypothetical protein [Clostridia bacterium]